MGASSPAMASGSSSTSRPSMSPEVRPMDGQALQATDRTVDGDLQLDAKAFRCITKMTRLRTNPGDARHDWCAAADGSPLREPRTQPGGCRGAQTTERAGEASPVRHEGKDHE